MSTRPYAGRQLVSALSGGLQFGLRVHVNVRPRQRVIFQGAENLSVQQLTSELAEMVSGLRVCSYFVRSRLEQLTGALQSNVQFGSWLYARRAALDLAALLAQAQKRREVGGGSLAVRGANAALRIAELCSQEAR